MSKEIISAIRRIEDQKPERFEKRSETLSLEEKPLQELEKMYLSRAIELLKHEELHHMIDEGKITLGMIKPRANEGKNVPQDDDLAARTVLDEIDGVILSIPLSLSMEEATKFYEPTVQQMREAGREDIAEDLINFTISGPLTVFVKIDDEGDAVKNWRAQMGPTQVKDAQEPEHAHTIRGRHAVLLPNNIVHGSDSKESAHREINLFAEFLETRLKKSCPQK